MPKRIYVSPGRIRKADSSGLAPGLQCNGDSLLLQVVFQGQLVAVFLQPVFTEFVIRHDGGHHVPEIFGMVHVGQVAEFMDYHIVQYPRGSKDQAVIEGQRPPGGTAAPAGLLVTDRDGGIMASGDGMEISRPGFQFGPGGILIPFFQYLQAFCLRLCESNNVLLCWHDSIIVRIPAKNI